MRRRTSSATTDAPATTSEFRPRAGDRREETPLGKGRAGRFGAQVLTYSRRGNDDDEEEEKK